MLSLIKYAVAALGVPALTTAVGIGAGAKSATESFSKFYDFTSRASGRLQMISAESHLKVSLDTLLRMNERTTYGEDYAYFGVSAVDGGLKMLDGSGPGDLYIIEVIDAKLALSGRRYLIYAKFGIDATSVRGGSYQILAHLPKRGSTLSKGNFDTFLVVVAQSLADQQDRIHEMVRAGAKP